LQSACTGVAFERRILLEQGLAINLVEVLNSLLYVGRQNLQAQQRHELCEEK
jgi:hypothetical protein